MHQDLIEKIQSYLIMWAESDAASRVDQVEGIAFNHGFEPYSGRTIAEYIEFFLQDLLLFIKSRPDVLATVELESERAQRIEQFLNEEKAKIEECDRLTAELEKYWFGPLDPRYIIASRKLRKVVRSFRTTDYLGLYEHKN